MKSIKYLILIYLLLPGITAFSQSKKTEKSDTAVSMKVFGVCEQCKERIEKAVKIKGVKSGVWNMETGQLALVYDPARVTLDKIENRIVAAGHDLENKKSLVAVYDALPKCCRYREPGSMTQKHDAVPANTQTVKRIDSPALLKDTVIPVNIIKGIVLEEDNKGKFTPLPNASISWLNTGKGVITDSAGYFSIHQDNVSKTLVVSYSGYKPDTIFITAPDELKVVLASNRQLKEVSVTSKQRSVYINNYNPIRTQTMTGKELLKAACCNLSESFETNPSVDVSYNDAVTGSKQIQLLGLSGNYTQLTVENLPGPRGIATPLGLNSIAGPWIESIQLTKGVGSVANGFESIAGQINVELKKPENSEKLLANLYINDYGKTDVNLNFAQKINKNWSAGLLLHDDFFTNKKLDFNKDGFRDLPTGNTFSLVNRYKFDNSKGTVMQLGIKILNDQRTGGETMFDPDQHKNTTSRYGLGINTERYEAFAKIGYIFPAKKYKSIGLQVTAINHKQDSYFGLTTYNAKQKTFYGNLIYQSIIRTTIHKFRTGVSFLYDRYDEDFKSSSYSRNEIVPGVFGEYTFTPNEKFSAVAGLRADHNNLNGFFVTPRLNLRYEPVTGTTIRASIGRGQRTANIFAENMGSFISARQVNIIASAPGKAYGLNPEVAWNKGISVDQKFTLFKHDAMVSVDYFRNDFKDQVVVDLENAGAVSFYNLAGKSFSNSLQAEMNFEPADKFEVRLAYRFFDVRSTYNGQLKERPLIAKNRAFANLAYTLKGFKFDYTVTYNGKKRLPDTKANLPAYQLEEFSKDYVMMNAQLSKTFGKKYPLDIYIGAENLTNFFQQNVIVSADQPFSNYFDASMVWGPVNGRMFYTGIRFKIK
ncbi:MAG: TonB-dependent receptor [Ferruginibacter sp.]|nr:TonB-dependent receptor [Ferruginibacter sp.]